MRTQPLNLVKSVGKSFTQMTLTVAETVTIMPECSWGTASPLQSTMVASTYMELITPTRLMSPRFISLNDTLVGRSLIIMASPLIMVDKPF